MGSMNPHDELLDMARTVQVDDALTAGHTTVYKTGEKWHTDPSCHHLRRGGVFWLRIYPLERALQFRFTYSTACSYCVPSRDECKRVIEQHDPRLVDEHGLVHTTLEEWEARA